MSFLKRSGLDNQQKMWYNISRKGGKGTLGVLTAVRTRRVAFMHLAGAQIRRSALDKN